MNETLADRAHVQDKFLADLTAAALEVAARAGVGGPSVNLEIELWKELDAVLRDWRTRPGTRKGGVTFNWSDRLAALTDAAYRIILEYQFEAPFVDLELALWQALRQVIRRQRFLHAGAAQHLSGVLAIA